MTQPRSSLRQKSEKLPGAFTAAGSGGGDVSGHGAGEFLTDVPGGISEEMTGLPGEGDGAGRGAGEFSSGGFSEDPSPPGEFSSGGFSEDPSPRYFGGRDSYVDGLPEGWIAPSSDGSVVQQMFECARQVYTHGACSMPGVQIKYDSFMDLMWAAVRKGFVAHAHAEFVAQSLRWGCEAGVQRPLLKGRRCFSNYASARGEFRGRVAAAITKRVEASKTLHLGPWSDSLRDVLGRAFGHFFIFPLGAVAKPLEPDDARPTDDHTKTGLNAATILGMLGHSLRTYEEVARFLKLGWVMHVSDVEAAFPMLPFAPWLWPFLLFRFEAPVTSALQLFCHVCGDFGTRGMPGTFKIFFVDVVCNMARSVGVLRDNMPVYVDDMGLIGAALKPVMRQMQAFQDWAELFCGVSFKRIKDKQAAHVQHMIGFWWDSFEGTRTLDERKMFSYMDMLLDFSSRRTLTLLERQQVAGRMQRAVLTMPPGAQCLMANMFVLMQGLKLPWHKRRTTAAERQDYRFFHDVLSLNLGRGYFNFDRFSEAPTIWSDASKQSRYSGGGWMSACGRADWFKYGASAARRPIDFLEGDTVVSAVEDMGPLWRRKWVPFGVDNQAFQRSAVKGWSRARRLTDLLKRLFVLQLRHECLLRFFWIASAANLLADHLSRGRVSDFFDSLLGAGMLAPGATVRMRADAGRVRHLPQHGAFAPEDLEYIHSLGRDQVDMELYSLMVTASVLLQAAARRFLARRRLRRGGVGMRGFMVTALLLGGAVGQAHAAPERGMQQQFSISYRRADLYTGLPPSISDWVDSVMDTRFAASSMRTVHSALVHWEATCARYGWETVIMSEDPERGGKMCAFVHHLTTDLTLVANSISNLVWGLRTWMKLQRQSDPLMGVENWHDFMLGARVLTHVPHEPRRAIPHDKPVNR